MLPSPPETFSFNLALSRPIFSHEIRHLEEMYKLRTSAMMQSWVGQCEFINSLLGQIQTSNRTLKQERQINEDRNRTNKDLLARIDQLEEENKEFEKRAINAEAYAKQAMSPSVVPLPVMSNTEYARCQLLGKINMELGQIVRRQIAENKDQ